ncbi:MAG TPA: DUF1579 family protein [Rhizomicrobium sp.]|nr:DUF1579 family protein [Rhizomicrobium sp.]
MGIAAPMLAAMLAAATATAEPTLYDRVASRLKNDPALARQLGHPARQMADVSWMIGTWDIATTVEAVRGHAAEKGTSRVTPLFGGVWLEIRDTYPGGNQDVSYLGFNPVSKRWVSVTVDGLGNLVTNTSAGWKDGRLVFVGDVIAVGERATLRQVITKKSENSYSITNEERMKGGHWRLLDTYRYEKRGRN